MRYSRAFRVVVVSTIAWLAVDVVNAQESVAADKITELLTGKTITSMDKKGRTVHKTFLADGELNGERDRKKNKRDTGKWWVPGDGQVCWKWQRWGQRREEKCRNVVEEAGVVYLQNPDRERTPIPE